jgi:hypothetical protein
MRSSVDFSYYTTAACSLPERHQVPVTRPVEPRLKNKVLVSSENHHVLIRREMAEGVCVWSKPTLESADFSHYRLCSNCSSYLLGLQW